MARARTAKHPQHVEPEEESQEIPEEQEALEATEPETISKAEAVRRALAAGKESPDEGVAYIREQFDLDMAKPMFSSYKAQMKARGKKGAPKGRPGRKPRTEGRAAPLASAPPRGDIIADIEATRGLIDRLGKDGLKRLIDALG